MLALGLESFVSAGGVPMVVVVVVVVGVLIVVVVVDDEFVGVVGLAGVDGVVVVVVGIEFPDDCFDLRDAAEMLVESFALLGVSRARDFCTPRVRLLATSYALDCDECAVVD